MEFAALLSGKCYFISFFFQDIIKCGFSITSDKPKAAVWMRLRVTVETLAWIEAAQAMAKMINTTIRPLLNGYVASFVILNEVKNPMV